MLKINKKFNERVTVYPKFFIIILTICGCIISVNQIFNIGFLNFNPVSNSFLYLLIAFFQPISFLVFPMTKKYEVKGDNAHAIYSWAKDTYGKAAVPKWNFHKILVNKEGKIIDTYPSFTNPMSKKVIKRIEKIL